MLKIEGAPGLGWRERKDGAVAYWIADAKFVQLGYPLKTQRLWPVDGAVRPGEPDERDQQYIRAECVRLQHEMNQFKLDRTAGIKDGKGLVVTMTDLSRAYQIDPLSRYQKLRDKSREYYDVMLRAIELTVGKRSLAAITGRDFLTWYEEWATDPDGSRHVPRAYARITMVRGLLSFGVACLDNKECVRLALALHDHSFENAKPRETFLTAEHAIAIRAKAHEMGRPEIALGQALQYELLVRQKDVIGELISLDSPGISAIIMGKKKWVLGMTWSEITPDLVMKHRLSKSIKTRAALADPKAGETKTWNLKNYEMVAEELALVPLDQRVGPLVKNSKTGEPFLNSEGYYYQWRKIADAAGVPSDVQNRDSRAGGITEIIEMADGEDRDGIEIARVAAGHSHRSMTERYSRNKNARTDRFAQTRSAKRGR